MGSYFRSEFTHILALAKEILWRTTETLTTVFNIRRLRRATYCMSFHLSLFAIVIYTLITLIVICIVEMILVAMKVVLLVLGNKLVDVS